MTSAALTLVLLASFIHAGWNFLTKKAEHRLVFLWLGLGVGLVIYAPAMVWVVIHYPPPLAGVKFMVASGAIHYCYYYALSRLYDTISPWPTPWPGEPARSWWRFSHCCSWVKT